MKDQATIVGDVMRELTALEIDQLDFSGRIPELNVCDYQLIGLASETPMKRKASKNAAPISNRSAGTRRLKTRLARTA